MAKFLNYSVSTSTDAKAKARGLRYVVTAEFVEGYEVLSYHRTKAEAVAQMKRYQEADKRRSAVYGCATIFGGGQS